MFKHRYCDLCHLHNYVKNTRINAALMCVYFEPFGDFWGHLFLESGYCYAIEAIA